DVYDGFHFQDEHSLHDTHNLDRGNPNAIKEPVCLQWLDSRKRRYVLYICFGNIVVLSNRQIEDVNAALEASKESFIWAIKDPPYSRVYDATAGKYAGGVLPPGFEKHTKDRGLVIRGWASQPLILSHSSVGDQFNNALLFVDYLKVRVRLCEGPTAMLNRDDLKSVVNTLFAPEVEERKRTEELSRAARMEVEIGGSSWKNLEGFVT
ncbi:hypothetical protein KI387_002429, partial [Taxus chinensis]